MIRDAKSLVKHLQSVPYHGISEKEGIIFIFQDTGYSTNQENQNDLVNIGAINLETGGYVFRDESKVSTAVVRICQEYQDFIFDTVSFNQ